MTVKGGEHLLQVGVGPEEIMTVYDFGSVVIDTDVAQEKAAGRPFVGDFYLDPTGLRDEGVVLFLARGSPLPKIWSFDAREASPIPPPNARNHRDLEWRIQFGLDTAKRILREFLEASKDPKRIVFEKIGPFSHAFFIDSSGEKREFYLRPFIDPHPGRRLRTTEIVIETRLTETLWDVSQDTGELTKRRVTTPTVVTLTDPSHWEEASDRVDAICRRQAAAGGRR